jgi:YD repeat-containing protein
MSIRQIRSDAVSPPSVGSISPSGRWIALTYDASQRITQATDNIGRTVTYDYSSGRLWKVTGAAVGITEYTYDSSHRMLTIEDARGITY